MHELMRTREMITEQTPPLTRNRNRSLGSFRTATHRETAAAPPSPLNGEKAGMRGESGLQPPSRPSPNRSACAKDRESDVQRETALTLPSPREGRGWGQDRESNA